MIFGFISVTVVAFVDKVKLVVDTWFVLSTLADEAIKRSSRNKHTAISEVYPWGILVKGL